MPDEFDRAAKQLTSSLSQQGRLRVDNNNRISVKDASGRWVEIDESQKSSVLREQVIRNRKTRPKNPIVELANIKILFYVDHDFVGSTATRRTYYVGGYAQNPAIVGTFDTIDSNGQPIVINAWLNNLGSKAWQVDLQRVYGTGSSDVLSKYEIIRFFGDSFRYTELTWDLQDPLGPAGRGFWVNANPGRTDSIALFEGILYTAPYPQNIVLPPSITQPLPSEETSVSPTSLGFLYLVSVERSRSIYIANNPITGDFDYWFYSASTGVKLTGSNITEAFLGLFGNRLIKDKLYKVIFDSSQQSIADIQELEVKTYQVQGSELVLLRSEMQPTFPIIYLGAQILQFAYHP